MLSECLVLGYQNQFGKTLGNILISTCDIIMVGGVINIMDCHQHYGLNRGKICSNISYSNSEDRQLIST